jgi:predicted PurR-regulated permease PerM
MVTVVQRARVPRGLSWRWCTFAFFTVLTVVGSCCPTRSPTDPGLPAGRPGLVEEANASLADVQRTFDEEGIDVEDGRQGQTALETLQDRVLEGSGEAVAFTGDLLRELVTVSIQLVLVLVLSIYMLLYGPRIGAMVRLGHAARATGTPDDDYPNRVQRAVSGYVRGQILFSTIMGTSAGAALWVYGELGIFEEGRTYAIAFGAFFGVMELIPFVGPFLGALPPIIVALFGDPLTAVWVALLFLALQQLEGHVVAPQVFSYTLRINPLLVIFALLFGHELYGLVGALIALPIAATLRETAVYLRRHLVLEPWGSAQLALAGATSATRRCADCATAAHSRRRLLPQVRGRAALGALACPRSDRPPPT